MKDALLYLARTHRRRLQNGRRRRPDKRLQFRPVSGPEVAALSIAMGAGRTRSAWQKMPVYLQHEVAELAKAGCADELPRIVGDETWPQPPKS
jgi:hypothetical protein